MPFTSPELVRAYLNDLRLGEAAIPAMSIVLSGTQPSQLPHAGLVPGSLVVKAPRSNTPVSERQTLQSDWITLTHRQILPGSVLVASDDSLGAVYAENVDYIADPVEGRIRRISTGAITNGQTVAIWYENYHVYTAGDDYIADESRGQLARKSSGAIADGQSVLVDYRAALGVVSDETIERAIEEAGDAVLAMIAPQFQDEPAPGIVIGETHWAVAVACRMRAAATIGESVPLNSAGRAAAQVWLDLADRYERSGRERLARFAAPVVARQSPKRT